MNETRELVRKLISNKKLESIQHLSERQLCMGGRELNLPQEPFAGQLAALYSLDRKYQIFEYLKKATVYAKLFENMAYN